MIDAVTIPNVIDDLNLTAAATRAYVKTLIWLDGEPGKNTSDPTSPWHEKKPRWLRNALSQPIHLGLLRVTDFGRGLLIEHPHHSTPGYSVPRQAALDATSFPNASTTAPRLVPFLRLCQALADGPRTLSGDELLSISRATARPASINVARALTSTFGRAFAIYPTSGVPLRDNASSSRPDPARASERYRIDLDWTRLHETPEGELFSDLAAAAADELATHINNSLRTQFRNLYQVELDATPAPVAAPTPDDPHLSGIIATLTDDDPVVAAIYANATTLALDAEQVASQVGRTHAIYPAVVTAIAEIAKHQSPPTTSRSCPPGITGAQWTFLEPFASLLHPNRYTYDPNRLRGTWVRRRGNPEQAMLLTAHNDGTFTLAAPLTIQHDDLSYALGDRIALHVATVTGTTVERYYYSTSWNTGAPVTPDTWDSTAHQISAIARAFDTLTTSHLLPILDAMTYARTATETELATQLTNDALARVSPTNPEGDPSWGTQQTTATGVTRHPQATP